MQSATQFRRLLLRTDHHLVRQQTSASFGMSRLLVPIEHPHFQFMPFYSLFLGLLSPALSSIAHLTSVHHQHTQLTASSLWQPFRRHLLVPLLGLFPGSFSHSLHQSMQSRIVHALSSPSAGYLGCFFIGPGCGHRKTKLLGILRCQLLVGSHLPSLSYWAIPSAGLRMLPVIKGEIYLA